MPPGYSWLPKLNLRQLTRLATYIGAPCSGTKPSRIQGIHGAIDEAIKVEAHQTRNATKSNPLSIVSIDMGIRNLAYCHLKTCLSTVDMPSESVWIDTWARTSIEDQSSSDSGNIQQTTEERPQPPSTRIKATRESYDPSVYAMRAHKFAKKIIESHQPTHILIERQRFRSGGSAAVQEWSIRVGVFEAMMYAALHTLQAEKHYDFEVVPMLPKRVNRYWLESDWEKNDMKPPTRPTANAVKLEKIACVERMLAINDRITNLDFSGEALLAKSSFLSQRGRQRSSSSLTKLKLDDLSDSFLQGLGWIHWQRNRLQVNACGPGALSLGSWQSRRFGCVFL